MATEKNIRDKALKCIDEFENSTVSQFPIGDFLGEAVRWVIDAVPVRHLTTSLTENTTNIEVSDGKAELNSDLDGRIVYVKTSDWDRPVTKVIYADDILYRQQSNPVLRGNPSRPVVAYDKALKTIELFTTKDSKVTVSYVPYDVEYIPTSLEDITAWKLAEIVFLAISDAQSAAVCSARVNEQLEMLAL
jgi:hypothetical protein